MNHDYNKEFFIDVENDVINYSKKDLLESISILEKGIVSKQNIIINILKITIYYYQRSNETAYLWKVDFTDESSNKNKSVDYGNIIALLIEGIKEQKEMIENLKVQKHLF
jgi:hypothetical protein